MPKKNLPLIAFEKILKEQGSLRIADESLIVFRNHIEERVREITLRARKYAKHAGRNTILESDIQLALKELE